MFDGGCGHVADSLVLRIGRPATAMLKGNILESALQGAPEGALGNRGEQGSALEGRPILKSSVHKNALRLFLAI